MRECDLETFNPYIGFILQMDDRAGIHVPANVELSGIHAIFMQAALPSIPLCVWVVLFIRLVTGCKPVGESELQIFSTMLLLSFN